MSTHYGMRSERLSVGRNQMLFNRADIMDAAARHIAPAGPATPGTASGGDSPLGNIDSVRQRRRPSPHLPVRHGNETPATVNPWAGVFSCGLSPR